MTLTAVEEPVIVRIAADADIVAARNTGREIASRLSFSTVDLTLIATAISEVARNIAVYAAPGRLSVQLVERDGRRGVRVTAVDDGPGIADIDRALQDGYSTGASLGVGLPGARRLMDDFEIASKVGAGTTITMIKWEH